MATLRSTSPWRFLVTDLQHNVLGDLPVRNVKISEEINDPVTISGVLSLTDAKTNRALLDPARTKIWALLNGVPKFACILWTIRPTIPGDGMQLATSDDLSYFHARVLRVTKVYAADDQGAIVKDLLDYAQAIPGGDIGMIVPSVSTGVDRDRTWYHYERPIIGKLISQMAEVIDGFDFWVEAGGNLEDGLTTTFRLEYPQRGGANGLRWRGHYGQAGNTIVSVNGLESADTMSNTISAIGMGEGDRMLYTEAVDESSLALGYPVLEDVITLKDVNIYDTLQGHADEYLRLHLRPPRTFKLGLRRGHPDTDLDAFTVGDMVSLDIQWGYYEVSDFTQLWRVQDRDIDIDDNTGATDITVTVTEVLD